MSRRSRMSSPSRRTLLHTAAKLHYLDGLSQIEVARRMEVSTASVSRLLAQARKEGIVRIDVADPDAPDDMAEALAAALELDRVRVMDTDRLAVLGAQVGAMLQEAALPPGAVIAIGWGRAVQSLIAGGLPALPGAVVVPTTGGMTETAAHFQINEFVRKVAEQVGGEARMLHAPARPATDLRAELVRDPGIAQVMDAWDRADVAIVGIGNSPQTAGDHGLGFAPEAHGRVVGDVVRHYFDRDGRAVPWPGQSSLMGITRAQLQRVTLSIGIAVGRDKVAAIIGAARSGMITALVTDAATARGILDHLASDPGPGASQELK